MPMTRPTLLCWAEVCLQAPPPPEKAQPPACPPCERKQARMLETYRACNLPLALLDLC